MIRIKKSRSTNSTSIRHTAQNCNNGISKRTIYFLLNPKMYLVFLDLFSLEL